MNLRWLIALAKKDPGMSLFACSLIVIGWLSKELIDEKSQHRQDFTAWNLERIDLHSQITNCNKEKDEDKDEYYAEMIRRVDALNAQLQEKIDKQDEENDRHNKLVRTGDKRADNLVNETTKINKAIKNTKK